MTKVYGRATSSNVQLVMWTIGELGLKYERLDYGHKFGGTDTPEFLEMNPMGRVPAMRDGNVVMFESGAIVRYLAAQYGSETFWPKDPAARAGLDMWAEWVKVTLAPSFAQPIFWQLLRHPAGQGGDTVQEAADTLKPLITMLDHRLGDGPWLGGEDFSFADIYTGHLLYRYQTLVFDKTRSPRLDAYYARLTLRPAFAEHVMVSFEPLRLV